MGDAADLDLLRSTNNPVARWVMLAFFVKLLSNLSSVVSIAPDAKLTHDGMEFMQVKQLIQYSNSK